jgi:erythromycin esterase-like protein
MQACDFPFTPTLLRPEAITMTAILSRTLAHDLHDAAHPLTGSPEDFDPLMDRIGDARFVLIGEASHGTHEFYRIRAEITKRLIRTRGFTAVAVEGDWPDSYRVNRYVRGIGSDPDASVALDGFKRFPQWMWRNADVLDFVGWLREHNDASPPGAREAGFYGLDLYSLHASLDAVMDYLKVVDPEAARRAAIRYGCFDRFGDDPQEYGYATTLGMSQSCEAEVVAQLVELNRAAGEYARRDGRIAKDDLFYAERNAQVVANAERYYRAMFGSRVSSWNVRDEHMADTLDALEAFHGRDGKPPKIVVWAHNSHLGDARATEMGSHGELNLGQLVRERHGGDAVLIGFSTYEGTVTAASDWGMPAERKTVRPGLDGSYEALFHESGLANFMLDLTPATKATAGLGSPRLQRAIGVIYRPETERMSHYYRASLRRQFDVVLHYDKTRAVEPLERSAEWERGELPETYPTSL